MWARWARMVFSIAVRARGAWRSSILLPLLQCSLRFEICNFTAARLCERLFRSRHARNLRGTHRLRTSGAERDQRVTVPNHDFMEEGLEPATVAAATRTGKLFSAEAFYGMSNGITWRPCLR